MSDELFPPDPDERVIADDARRLRDDTEAFKREFVASWPPKPWAWLVCDDTVINEALGRMAPVAPLGGVANILLPGASRMSRRAVAEQVLLDESWPAMLVRPNLGQWVLHSVVASLGPGELDKLPAEFRWAVQYLAARWSQRGSLVE